MDERRTRNAGPQTQLMVAWKGMTPHDRHRVQIAGGALLSFTVGVPVVAEVALAVLERPELPMVVWVFSSGFAIVSVAMIFPPLGVWVVSTAAPTLAKLLPGVLARLVPSGLVPSMFQRQERRAPRED